MGLRHKGLGHGEVLNVTLLKKSRVGVVRRYYSAATSRGGLWRCTVGSYCNSSKSSKDIPSHSKQDKCLTQKVDESGEKDEDLIEFGGSQILQRGILGKRVLICAVTNSSHWVIRAVASLDLEMITIFLIERWSDIVQNQGLRKSLRKVVWQLGYSQGSLRYQLNIRNNLQKSS